MKTNRKKLAREHKYQWNKALLEGRTVRTKDGMSWRNFVTKTEADAFLAANGDLFEAIVLEGAALAEVQRIVAEGGAA